MITLYIPTTSLNFNNILSSESISPKAFYERRGFGYRRWMTVDENNNDNAIYLYASIPSFNRPDNGLEDHPLVVQVSLDESQVKKCGNGVFYSDKTIYLDPWHTQFIFQSDQDRRITLSMSDSSSETKLIRLYRNLLTVSKGERKYDIPSYNNIALNEIVISNDFRLNRIKGLLYGYYIGANMSLGKDEVKEMSAMKELQNILSSIQSSDDHIPSSTQRVRLHQLLGLAAVIYDIDISNGQMLNRVGTSLLMLERVADNKKVLLLPESHEIEISNWHVTSLRTINDDEEQELVKTWTDLLLSPASVKYNGKISTINKELSDELTVKAKEVYGEDWGDSYAKVFLNDLRRHIRGEAFNEQWNNALLSSIAAVLTHGDGWRKLLAFMQAKGIYDYRIAFALYGLLNGFANLTRDFTDSLFELKSSYVAAVYKDIYKQLFGKELDTNVVISDIEQVNDIEQIATSSEDKDNSNIKPQESTGKETAEPKSTHNKGICFKEKLKELFNIPKLSKDQKDSLKKAIEDNGNNDNPDEFIKKLKKQKGWSKGKKIKYVRESLLGEVNILDKSVGISQPDLFSQPTKEPLIANHSADSVNTSAMIKDNSWWLETANFTEDEKARDQYLEDIKWFI